MGAAMHAEPNAEPSQLLSSGPACVDMHVILMLCQHLHHNASIQWDSCFAFGLTLAVGVGRSLEIACP